MDLLSLLTGFSLGAIGLLMIAVVKDFRSMRVGQIFLALLVATAIFVLDPLLPHQFDSLVVLMMSAIPGLFWLFCHHAFGETPKLSPALLVIALWTVLGPAGLMLMDAHGLWLLLLKQIPSYGEYVLIGAGLWTVVEHWSADLVSSRRRLRAVVVVLTGLTILLNVVSVNFGFGGQIFQRELVALCLVGIAAQTLIIPRGLLFGTALSETEPQPGQALPDVREQRVQAQLQQLQQVMLDGFYRQEKPTVAGLAKAVSVPEYVLRSLINEHLGFRNFNAYVNDWRINEAKAQLVSQPETPIMNIALDLGYRTLSSFNRAFKERVEQTPSQYRQAQLNQASV